MVTLPKDVYLFTFLSVHQLIITDVYFSPIFLLYPVRGGGGDPNRETAQVISVSDSSINSLAFINTFLICFLIAFFLCVVLSCCINFDFVHEFQFCIEFKCLLVLAVFCIHFWIFTSYQLVTKLQIIKSMIRYTFV